MSQLSPEGREGESRPRASRTLPSIHGEDFGNDSGPPATWPFQKLLARYLCVRRRSQPPGTSRCFAAWVYSGTNSGKPRDSQPSLDMQVVARGVHFFARPSRDERVQVASQRRHVFGKHAFETPNTSENLHDQKHVVWGTKLGLACSAPCRPVASERRGNLVALRTSERRGDIFGHLQTWPIPPLFPPFVKLSTQLVSIAPGGSSNPSRPSRCRQNWPKFPAMLAHFA